MLSSSGLRTGVLLLALLLIGALCAGCGTRRSHQALLAAAQGSGGATLAAGSDGAATGAGTAGDQGTAGSAGSAGSAASAGSATRTGGAGQAGAGSSAAGAGAGTAKGAPIVIGSVGTQSGIVGASISDGTRALQAW